MVRGQGSSRYGVLSKSWRCYQIFSFGCRKDGDGRGGAYKFWGGHRKVRYMETLVAEGEGRVYRFCKGHRKVEYLMALVRRSKK